VDCAHLLEKLCTWLNDPRFQPEGVSRIPMGLLRAILAHLYIAWIHPFGDGNGRTARLVEFEVLVASGVPSPAAHLLSNHYNITRAEYYRQLDAASRAGGGPFGFIEYALQGFVDGLRSQLEWVKAQQHQLAWRDYARDILRGYPEAAGKRLSALVEAVTASPEAVSIAQMPELSPRLAALYAQKSPRTLLRDIALLTKLELLERQPDRHYRARTELLEAFLPVRVQGR
jgi:Fic family protein